MVVTVSRYITIQLFYVKSCSCNKYSLSNCFMPSIFPDTGNTQMNSTDEVLLLGAYNLMGEFYFVRLFFLKYIISLQSIFLQSPSGLFYE